jgi:hypothetical protein
MKAALYPIHRSMIRTQKTWSVIAAALAALSTWAFGADMPLATFALCLFAFFGVIICMLVGWQRALFNLASIAIGAGLYLLIVGRHEGLSIAVGLLIVIVGVLALIDVNQEGALFLHRQVWGGAIGQSLGTIVALALLSMLFAGLRL